MGSVIELNFSRQPSKMSACSVGELKATAITHIERASKILAKLNEAEKRHSWVLEDIAGDLRDTLKPREKRI